MLTQYDCTGLIPERPLDPPENPALDALWERAREQAVAEIESDACCPEWWGEALAEEAGDKIAAACAAYCENGDAAAMAKAVEVALADAAEGRARDLVREWDGRDEG